MAAEQGFWTPHTASIDWCEANYSISYFFAEFWNSISSLALVAFPLINMYRARKARLSTRFIVAQLAFIFVGIGSTLFHGTLRYEMQMLDELPMVYSMCAYWYILLQDMELPCWRQNWRSSVLPQGDSASSSSSSSSFSCNGLAIFLIAYALFWTFIHSMSAFVVAFQLHFVLLVTLSWVRFTYVFCTRPGYGLPSIRWMIIGYFVFLIIASTSWLLDQFACPTLSSLPYGLPNPQLHAWWHFFVSLSSHLACVIVEAYHRIKLSGSVKIDLLGGFLPVVNHQAKPLQH